MRWFLGLLKILMVVCLVAFAANFLFAYTSGVKPFENIYEKVKWFKENGSEKKNNENQKAGNEEEKSGNDKIEPGPETYEKVPDESEKNNNAKSNSGEYYMTFNEVNSIENISQRDKLTGLSIMSKVKKSDIERIFELANNGITLDELKEVKKILERNLSKEDIEKLDDLLMKNRKLYAEGKLKN